MKLRAWILFLSGLLAAGTASGQTVQLIGSNLGKDVIGSPFTGKLCMTPATGTGTPINFQWSTGGQGATSTKCVPVTASALAAGVTVPDTALTNPQNLCLFTQLIDPSARAGRSVVQTLPCLQPASTGQSGWCTTTGGVTTCNIDAYVLTATAIPVTVTNTVAIDGTARSAASVAQSSANSAQATANAALPASGCSNAEGSLSCSEVHAAVNGVINPCAAPYNAKCDGSSDDSTALQSAVNGAQTIASHNAAAALFVPAGKTLRYGTTLQVLAGGSGSIRLYGPSGPNSYDGGGILSYSGTGNAIAISQSGSGGESVRIDDLQIQCALNGAGTNTCGNLIDVGQVMGPVYIDHNLLNGNHNTQVGYSGNTYGQGGAANGIVLHGATIQIKIRDNFAVNFSSQIVAVNGGMNVDIYDNQFFDAPIGVYLSQSGPVSVFHNYFELMTYGVKVSNDSDWTRGQYDIYGNQFNLQSIPPIYQTTAPNYTGAQRCLLVTNGTQGNEMGNIGAFHDNLCNESHGYQAGAQGIAPYGVDFEIANPAAVDLRWTITNNQFVGVTTSGIYSNSAIPQIDYADNLVAPTFNASTPTSSLPQVAGIAAYAPLPGRSNDGAMFGKTAASGSYGFREFHHVFEYATLDSGPSGTLKLALPVAVRNAGVYMTLRITGTSDSSGSWQLLVSGKNNSGGWAWGNATAIGVLPFTTVRLADDGTANCILLGTTATSWFSPRVSVDAFVGYYSGQGSLPAGWTSGWSAALLSSETGITVNATPNIGINVPNVQAGQVQIGGSQWVTGVTGNGASFAATTGSFTQNNIRTSDASSNEKDSGVGINSVIQKSGGTQTAGQLACIKAVGPPVVVGTCTAVSGATCTTCN